VADAKIDLVRGISALT